MIRTIPFPSITSVKVWEPTQDGLERSYFVGSKCNYGKIRRNDRFAKKHRGETKQRKLRDRKYDVLS
jgi:hypothetical protein